MKYLLVALIVLLPTAALAKGECKGDKEKFCKDVEKVRACLKEHVNDISEACKAKLEANAGGKQDGKAAAEDNKSNASPENKDEQPSGTKQQ